VRSVEIASNGQITIYCDGAEMGNGLGTAVANRVAAHLGGVADEVAMMQVDTFGPLDLVSSGDSFTIDQKTQDAGARNPRWVPTISSATAASTGASPRSLSCANVSSRVRIGSGKSVET
jgi:CO/xanthine dehydrogenase Mo-binding subunit